jgi:hypothetical protein
LLKSKDFSEINKKVTVTFFSLEEDLAQRRRVLPVSDVIPVRSVRNSSYQSQYAILAFLLPAINLPLP